MPSKLIKKEDERLWQKAKDLAEEAGHKENYAYIMGIFKKMNPERFSMKTNRLSSEIMVLARAIKSPRIDLSKTYDNFFTFKEHFYQISKMLRNLNIRDVTTDLQRVQVVIDDLEGTLLREVQKLEEFKK